MQSQIYYNELLTMLNQGATEEDFRAKLAEYSSYADTLELRVQSLQHTNKSMQMSFDEVDLDMDESEYDTNKLQKQLKAERARRR